MAQLKFGDSPKIREAAKLKSPPNKTHIWSFITICIAWVEQRENKHKHYTVLSPVINQATLELYPARVQNLSYYPNLIKNLHAEATYMYSFIN